ncbi:hypothetical protein [Xenorhabdus koppenhoeferi]|uniref:hypothetical protein n=1 Tax=Xenorhabdus koppenhoeferi TaxID=351659 RepID=UPI000AE68192|nr:hypothetical protein [Xenorhabdus koppenhoeferi]
MAPEFNFLLSRIGATVRRYFGNAFFCARRARRCLLSVVVNHHKLRCLLWRQWKRPYT